MKYRRTSETHIGIRSQRTRQRLRVVMEKMVMLNLTEMDSLPRRRRG
jgi:hypothetical protein